MGTLGKEDQGRDQNGESMTPCAVSRGRICLNLVTHSERRAGLRAQVGMHCLLSVGSASGHFHSGEPGLFPRIVPCMCGHGV